MMLDDLLALLPGLRRRRSMNADWLRLLLDRQDGECTWCGKLVGRGRRQWCGQECVEAFQLRCDTEKARRHVLKRDGGLCRRCGRDTVQAEKEAERIGLKPYPFPLRGETKEEFALRREVAIERLRVEFGYSRGRWREVDHDPPVALYGGLCPVEQLRLLCGACHAAATEALTSQLAKKRRAKRA